MLRVWSWVLIMAILLDVTVPCAPRYAARQIAAIDLVLLIAGLILILVTQPKRGLRAPTAQEFAQ